MMIIGVDYHPSFQTIALLIEECGECGEQELKHSDGEAAGRGIISSCPVTSSPRT